MNEREFSWRVSLNGQVSGFSSRFRTFSLELEDLVTDLFQFWMPGFGPVLPEGAVGEGDSWTGERIFQMPFLRVDMMSRNALVGLKISYKVNKIQEKKGRVEVTIEEGREIVLLHRVSMEVGQPEVTKAGEKEPIGAIRAKVNLKSERKLEKLEGG